MPSRWGIGCRTENGCVCCVETDDEETLKCRRESCRLPITTRRDVDWLVAYSNTSSRISKNTILKPTPGCGKTYATVQYLRHLVDRNIRIAWVTSRRALNQNMEGRLGVSLFTWNSYLDFDKDQKVSAQFEETNGVLISVQQLYHLQKKHDIVVLDEIEVTLNTFSGAADTHTHKKIPHAVDNFAALVGLLMQAKKVIAMDALVSKKTIRLTQNIEASNE